MVAYQRTSTGPRNARARPNTSSRDVRADSQGLFTVPVCPSFTRPPMLLQCSCSDFHCCCCRCCCWVCSSPLLHTARVPRLWILLIRPLCAPPLQLTADPYRNISTTSWRSCRGSWTLPTALAPSTRESTSRSSVSPSAGTSLASSLSRYAPETLNNHLPS